MDEGHVQWRKSSRSQHGGEGECVEVSTNLASVTLIRDSKAPGMGHVVLWSGEMAGLLADIKAGRFG
ncbi:DUF397 domain-containing protein [Actinomadura sp. 6N118]|uniref:DUF397 domain-containing protein n=1 Tax=Actinomadura sp. 6N118 TaxID=3375151 RepID=UPI00378AA239